MSPSGQHLSSTCLRMNISTPTFRRRGSSEGDLLTNGIRDRDMIYEARYNPPLISFPHSHAPPFSTSCPHSGRFLDYRGTSFVSFTPLSTCTAQTSGPNLTASSPGHYLPLSTLLTDFSCPPAIHVTYLSLSRSGGRHAHRRSPNCCRGVLRHLGGHTRQPQGHTEVPSLLCDL